MFSIAELMHLLFIKLKHIGDALLLTPTLTAVRERYPDAHITVVVRKGTEGILAGCSAIDEILTSAAPEARNRGLRQIWDDLQVVRAVRRRRVDYAFELSDGDRGRFLAILSGARIRCATRVATRFSAIQRGQFHRLSDFDWRFCHRVEKDHHLVSENLSLSPEIPPLCFDPRCCRTWERAEAINDFAVIHPGTRWQRKRWPAERWIEVGRRLLERVPHVIVSTGPDAEERREGRRICEGLGGGALATEGQVDWAQLAGLLHRARLFVGVDTAAMHLAAACRCPTVALFGPSVESAWHPWKVPHRLVMADAARIAAEDPEYFRKKEILTLESLGVDDVWTACEDLLATEASGR